MIWLTWRRVYQQVHQPPTIISSIISLIVGNLINQPKQEAWEIWPFDSVANSGPTGLPLQLPGFDQLKALRTQGAANPLWKSVTIRPTRASTVLHADGPQHLLESHTATERLKCRYWPCQIEGDTTPATVPPILDLAPGDIDTKMGENYVKNLMGKNPSTELCKHIWLSVYSFFFNFFEEYTSFFEVEPDMSFVPCIKCAI